MTEPCHGGDTCVVCEYERARPKACLDCDGECEDCMPETRALSKFPRKPTPEGTPA